MEIWNALVVKLVDTKDLKSLPFWECQFESGRGHQNNEKIKFYIHILVWCPRPDSNRHSINGKDFKSFVSTNFTTRAFLCLLVFMPSLKI